MFVNALYDCFLYFEGDYTLHKCSLLNSFKTGLRCRAELRGSGNGFQILFALKLLRQGENQLFSQDEDSSREKRLLDTHVSVS